MDLRRKSHWHGQRKINRDLLKEAEEIYFVMEVSDMNRNDIEQAIEILKEKIPLNMKNHVKKIVIYGSCARGDYTENSDIDVAILTDCDRLQAKKYDDLLMDIVTDIAMETNTIVEYTCIPENEFMEKKAWYAYFKNIEKEGRVIYG